MKDHTNEGSFSSRTEETESPVLERCPFCGSRDTCEQGVVWCEKCGAEEEYILYREEADGWWSGPYATPKCKCDRPTAVWNISARFRSRGVQKCRNCGAIRNAVCPVCGAPAWTRDGKTVCRRCLDEKAVSGPPESGD